MLPWAAPNTQNHVTLLITDLHRLWIHADARKVTLVEKSSFPRVHVILHRCHTRWNACRDSNSCRRISLGLLYSFVRTPPMPAYNTTPRGIRNPAAASKKSSTSLLMYITLPIGFISEIHMIWNSLIQPLTNASTRMVYLPALAWHWLLHDTCNSMWQHMTTCASMWQHVPACHSPCRNWERVQKKLFPYRIG